MKSMKKLVLVGLILLASVMVLLPLVGCKSEVDPEPPKYTVKFSKGSNTDEVSDLTAELRVESGTVLTAEQLKSLADTVNCCFTGWYDGETEVEAGTYKVTKNVTLTAGWVEKFITFSAASEQTLTMKIEGRYTLSDSLKYSVGGGEWKKLQADAAISFGGTAGDLRMRGKSLEGMAKGRADFACIVFGYEEVKVSCSGDIRTLVDFERPTTVDTSNARFSFLFKNCSVLTKAPALPAENLADSCYEGMFYGCENLTSAPALDAETLAEFCYLGMFYGCTSLTSAPALPAKTLVPYCYYSMFEGCERLTSVTMLATDISAEFCLRNWLYSVSETGTFTKAAKMDKKTLQEYIPAGWTVQD